MADSVFGRKIFGLGNFCGSAFVCCSDWNGQWSEFYRRTGWSCIQCDGFGGNVFTVVAIGTKSGIEPITCAVVGALLGFLLFNVYPASVFMGDTGSLALGGFVASTAYMLQMPFFIAIVGLIYLIEVLSVMIQVTYFKKTGGKRIFKMAPIHHHFELCGWSETRVVAVFSIVTAILCLIALMAI